ncbi:class I adenylate-forming enzyme family protein [Methylobacterium sp. NEAU K]|uniref:class I adenylate-forming enzyme family protein n=1 Tax=Methylobacterium sp. NEAU K TaxID=3064946 RepID=UPI00273401B7|nr:fatty acid--CoA ligase family protein [Methylobacterium sp. NEAU K]MDP4005624.1 fatty acid--CoA ligase family protein [Methylobacterium sp. NEAU K]
MTGALAAIMLEGLARPGSRVDEASGPGLSGHELDTQADLVAGLLLGAGVRPQEPVHVAIGNRASDLGALLGVWRAGAVTVPVHRSAAPLTRATVERATRARFLIDGLALDTIAGEPPPERPLLDGAALVVFTSGSTGTPKGVVLGHAALARKLSVLDGLLAFRPDDVVVVPLQLTFIFGIWTSLLAIRSGATLVLVEKFTRATLAGVLAEKATVLAAVPTMLRVLMTDGAPAAPRLRAVLTGGEALSPSLARAVGGSWPEAEIVDLYGSTETGSCDFCHRPRDTGDAGSIGVPTEGVSFRIVRDDGILAPPGAVGELRIRTACGMLGYLDNAELTRTAFEADHFRTGDLARLRPDGQVELVGRSKEIISRGGNKISPLEIENALCAHPDVAAALCAGVPDERLGEAIHAVVVLKPGLALTADELRRWASVNLERYKVPDVIVFSDVLPSGATGKASRAMVSTLTLAGTDGSSAGIHRPPSGL